MTFLIWINAGQRFSGHMRSRTYDDGKLWIHAESSQLIQVTAVMPCNTQIPRVLQDGLTFIEGNIT